MKPFRERKGKSKSGFYSGELAEAGKYSWDFIDQTIKKHNLKLEDGYHVETRSISIPGVNINDDTHGHWSDDEIIQILDHYGEVVALSYIHRNDMNCAEVITVDLM